MKIKEILESGNNILKEYNIEDSSLKSRMLLKSILNKSKEYLLIHYDEEINEKFSNLFFKNIERLKNHEPIQYIINYQEFMGFDFYVDKNVLIPRADTENLVEEVLYIFDRIYKEKNKEIKVLDLCTGSGAIAVSLAKLLKKRIQIYASDVSEKALKVAEKNSIKNDVSIIFLKSNLLSDISEDYKFDIIVSNPPYIETETIKTLSEEVKNEPVIALDGGEDGLDFYRTIIKDAKKYLTEDGFLAFEIGYNQKKSVEKIFSENQYRNIYSKKDLAGNDRIVVAQI